MQLKHASDTIEYEALSEQVFEVERQSPWQGLQTQQAKQTASARIDVEKAAIADLQLETAIDMRQCEVGRCAVPVGLDVDVGGAMLDIGHAVTEAR